MVHVSLAYKNMHMARERLCCRYFSQSILRLKICSVVLLPALKPACSLMISSAWGFSLFYYSGGFLASGALEKKPLASGGFRRKVFSFRGLCSLTPTRGVAPEPHWELQKGPTPYVQAFFLTFLHSHLCCRTAFHSL